MKAICIYMGCTKVITDYRDIRLLVTISFISGMTKQIPMIKLVLESAHQMVSNDVLYII